MSVHRIFESPRVTKPYTEEQWQEIAALGTLRRCAKLRAGDVRLTMGGEPTFISIDDADGAEWTTQRARALATSAGSRSIFFLSCAIVSLPADCFISGKANGTRESRFLVGHSVVTGARTACRSGKIRALIADDKKDYGYNAADARRFLEALTRRLEVDDSFIMTALEDVFYYLWKERRLPANVDPLDSKLEDPIERAGLARIFEEGLGKTVGYVLPLRRIPASSGSPYWTSQPWFLASQRLFLVPGDSSIGYRLPLESLPWTKPEDAEWSFDPDPFQQRDRLPEKPARKRQMFTEQELTGPDCRKSGAGDAA